MLINVGLAPLASARIPINDEVAWRYRRSTSWRLAVSRHAYFTSIFKPVEVTVLITFSGISASLTASLGQQAVGLGLIPITFWRLGLFDGRDKCEGTVVPKTRSAICWARHFVTA